MSCRECGDFTVPVTVRDKVSDFTRAARKCKGCGRIWFVESTPPYSGGTPLKYGE